VLSFPMLFLFRAVSALTCSELFTAHKAWLPAGSREDWLNDGTDVVKHSSLDNENLELFLHRGTAGPDNRELGVTSDEVLAVDNADLKSRQTPKATQCREAPAAAEIYNVAAELIEIGNEFAAFSSSVQQLDQQVSHKL
jgi:hypothetical protein